MAGSHDDEVVTVSSRLLHDHLPDELASDDAELRRHAFVAEMFHKRSHPPRTCLVGDCLPSATTLFEGVEDNHLSVIMRC